LFKGVKIQRINARPARLVQKEAKKLKKSLVIKKSCTFAAENEFIYSLKIENYARNFE